ncbi:WD repeat-containing protein 86-like [Penaeus vannamei]|uniref:WD repeat-containing protein 86-like n=1 Tax=Penaeus vannamei TaxID=6689 RepID=UPI00387F88BF
MGGGGSKENENPLRETMCDHTDAINCVALSEDGSLLVTGSEDKTARMWSTKTEETECLGVLKGHTSYITCVAITNAYIITGAADNTVRKWDMTTCDCLYVYEDHTSRIARVICTDEFIFSTSYDKTAKAWLFDADDLDVGDKAVIRTFTGHHRGVYPIIYIPAVDTVPEDSEGININPGDLIITGSADATARSWSFDTGNCLKIFKGHKAAITCMATDPQARILYTGGGDKEIRCWTINRGDCLKILEGHTGPIICLIVVNRLMYSGSADGTAKCWVREFGDCTRTYRGHKHSVVCAKFSDGILYTGCGDAVVRAFDAKSGSIRKEFKGHNNAVTCLTVCGDKVYSGSSDSTLRVWDCKNIREDPGFAAEDLDNDDDEEGEGDDFKKKQLDDLDERLDDYIGGDVDEASKPASAASKAKA